MSTKMLQQIDSSPSPTRDEIAVENTTPNILPPEHTKLMLTASEASWVAASLLCLRSIWGAGPAGLIPKYFGRKKILLYLALPLVVSWILVASSPYVYGTYVGRFVGEVDLGAFSIGTPPYIEDITEKHILSTLANFYHVHSSCVTLILIWSALFALWYWMKPRRTRSPPTYPGAWPIIGHAHMLIGDAEYMWNTEKNLYNYCVEKNDIVKFRLGTHSVYIISDPDDSLTVANQCFEKPYIYQFAKEMYGRGLLTANASVWKPHRKLLHPAFNQQVLHTLVEQYIIQAKKLVAELSSEVGKELFDVRPYLTYNLLETACRTTLGPKCVENSVTTNKYAHAVEDLFMLYLNRLQRIWLHSPFIFNWSSYKKKQDNIMKVMKDITKAVISNRKSDLKCIGSTDQTEENGSRKFKPLLDQMLDLAKNQDVFTEDEIREHLDTMIGAAYDTTTTTLTLNLILIGSHQDVQERMYKELQEVLGNQERDLNRHDLPKLVYMEAVIKETLRVYPIIPRIARCSSTDVQLKNYILPPNSTYVISVYGLSRHPTWGADADKFRPERWLDPATLPKNPSVYASFSLGRRNCIGKLHAIMLIKTILAYILRTYRIKSDVGKLVTRCDLLLKPTAGHEISLERRM